MFDIEGFVEECRAAIGDADAAGAVRDVLRTALENPAEIARVLARETGGIEVLYSSVALTVLNASWPPKVTLYPHEHRMWATIGIYTGAESNTMFRRGAERIEPASERLVEERQILSMGAEAIHSVHNPRDRFTGAIHLYGGDFLGVERSQWDPETLDEEPYSLEQVGRVFALATERWRSGQPAAR